MSVHATGGYGAVMSPLSRRSSWPLYLQIADDLRNQILQRQLRPGERLPSEHSLMERYGASRQTVRKAVAVLKAEGLLDAAQGQGVFVRERAPVLRRCRGGSGRPTGAVGSCSSARAPGQLLRRKKGGSL